jgi:hypothetical protein
VTRQLLYRFGVWGCAPHYRADLEVDFAGTGKLQHVPLSDPDFASVELAHEAIDRALEASRRLHERRSQGAVA